MQRELKANATRQTRGDASGNGLFLSRLIPLASLVSIRPCPQRQQQNDPSLFWLNVRSTMAKRKTRAKRSLGALPKGLPQRRKHGLSAAADVNPFEVSSRQKRAKHEVHNRRNNTAQQHTNPQSALAKSLQRRQTQLKETLATSKKANAFVDRRIGEYNTDITADEQMLARLVRERSRRSKRASKYSLEEDNDEVVELTHKGRTIDDLTAKDHVMLSDNEEDGNLDALDTELHFGGGSFGRPSAYGPGADDTNMSQLYLHKKMELDDLIARRKVLKAERVRSKEEQANAFENMDDSFKEIASMLQFRDKEKEYKQREEARKSGNLTQEDEEMADWDKEMKVSVKVFISFPTLQQNVSSVSCFNRNTCLNAKLRQPIGQKLQKRLPKRKQSGYMNSRPGVWLE
jgi:nucleolar protein 14